LQKKNAHWENGGSFHVLLIWDCCINLKKHFKRVKNQCELYSFPTNHDGSRHALPYFYALVLFMVAANVDGLLPWRTSNLVNVRRWSGVTYFKTPRGCAERSFIFLPNYKIYISSSELTCQ
jgi:hypothetical protein